MPFCGPHKKSQGVRGLIKNDHIQFDPKLGDGISAIHWIPSSCVECTSMLDKPWINSLPSQEQMSCQNVTECTYWTVLG